jgi:hypothetical protein
MPVPGTAVAVAARRTFLTPETILRVFSPDPPQARILYRALVKQRRADIVVIRDMLVPGTAVAERDLLGYGASGCTNIQR